MSDEHDDAPEQEHEPGPGDEREAFARRAEWWRRHYGDDATEADEKIREAAEHQERESQPEP